MIHRLRIAILLLIATTVCYSQQLRGTWLSRNSFTSKSLLAAEMDSLAANNFNVVYVDVWARGYTHWKSNAFYSNTGIYIDPTYDGRDILDEAIAEGHRNGLQVVAWFEYGFVGGWTGNIPPGQKGPIFNAHPDWVAKKKDGTEIDGSNFYWMIHTHIGVQNFLIALAAEIARNYDVDGIQLDRIRYSSLDYGYDSVTVNLYKTEHGGSSPPTNISNSGWIRWRADKLNDFVARFYDSIKTINPFLQVSNAPSHYSSTLYTSYNSFCQDWIWWVDNNKVDDVQLQMYVASSTTFGAYLNFVIANVINKSKVYPSFAIKPGGTAITDTELLNFFTVTAQKGFAGNTIWYFDDLVSRFSFIKSNVYAINVSLPYSTHDWRQYQVITPISNTNDAVRLGNWMNSSNAGFSGNSIYTTKSVPSSIDYYCNIPVDGYYEVYVFNVVSSNRTNNAEYTIYHSNGTQNTYVDQTNTNNTRWVKLSDFYFTSGRKRIVQLTNSNLPADKFLSADAVFISLNRRLSPVELITTLSIKCIPEGLYDMVSNQLSSKDTVHVYLRSVSAPYSVVDSAIAVIDSLTFSGEFTFLHATTGTYYIILQHRNSIETWSKAGGEEIVKGNDYDYDFTQDSVKAFGNNMVKKGAKWCIYSGDINQDGLIDLNDILQVDNSTFSFASGYLSADLNGDKIVDLTDLIICANNAYSFVGKIIPTAGVKIQEN
jgi:hypothetical protein